MKDLLELLGIISISSVGVGSILAYIFKRSFDSILKHRLDRQKMELDKEISLFKVELEKLASQNQFVFQKLHEERAEIMKSLYAKLISYWRSNQGFLFGIKDSLDIKTINEFNEYANQKQIELVQYYEQNRLYFSKNILSSFEQFMHCIDEVNDKINKLLKRKDVFVAVEIIEISDKEKKLQEIIAKTTKKYWSIINEIESEFRKLLGVET
jgi:hypothetical protein